MYSHMPGHDMALCPRTRCRTSNTARSSASPVQGSSAAGSMIAGCRAVPTPSHFSSRCRCDAVWVMEVAVSSPGRSPATAAGRVGWSDGSISRNKRRRTDASDSAMDRPSSPQVLSCPGCPSPPHDEAFKSLSTGGSEEVATSGDDDEGDDDEMGGSSSSSLTPPFPTDAQASPRSR